MTSTRQGFGSRVWCAAAMFAAAGLTMGCATSVGYAVGSSIDDRHARLEFHGEETVRIIPRAERVRLRCRDGSEKEGAFAGIDPGVVLLRQTPSGPASAIPVGDISAVGLWQRPKTATGVGVFAGVLLDVATFVLIARSSISLGNIGPIK